MDRIGTLIVVSRTEVRWEEHAPQCTIFAAAQNLENSDVVVVIDVGVLVLIYFRCDLLLGFFPMPTKTLALRRIFSSIAKVPAVLIRHLSFSGQLQSSKRDRNGVDIFEVRRRGSAVLRQFVMHCIRRG